MEALRKSKSYERHINRERNLRVLEKNKRAMRRKTLVVCYHSLSILMCLIAFMAIVKSDLNVASNIGIVNLMISCTPLVLCTRSFMKVLKIFDLM